MNDETYLLATADILTAATLAKPEARKAAVEAVVRSYFPKGVVGNWGTPINTAAPEIKATTGIMSVLPVVDGCTSLLIRKSGEVEEWQGNTFMGTHLNLEQAARFIGGRTGK